MACLLSLVMLSVALRSLASPVHAPASMSPDESTLHLPFVAGDASPSGSYYCYEYEFGLIWTSEVITLNTDGSSMYSYYPPYTDFVTGTWAYTPSIPQVEFTNFRWTTATYEAPDRLWASRYLPHVDFEIAIDCGRITSAE
jgi:hypothetical protein